MNKIKTKSISLPYFVIIALTLVVMAVHGVLPATMVDPVIRILIYMLFGMGTNILAGYIGLIPMGQAVFVGISSYSYTILMTTYNVSIVPALILSLAISVLSAVVLGFFCLKGGEGFAVGFIYMGFNTLFSLLCTKVRFFGLEAGISGAGRFEIFASNENFLVLVAGVVGACYLLMYLLLHSPAAMIMKGIRENPERITYFGVNIFNFRLITFVISAAFTSVGGLLYSMYLRGAYPNMCSNSFSLQMLMMCVIGGMYYFTGPTYGAIFVCLLFSRLSNLTIYWQSIVGILLIVVCMFMRGGLTGFFDSKIKTPIVMKLREKKKVRVGGR